MQYPKQLTTEDHYYDMLGAVPPEAYGSRGAFLLGEPMGLTPRGRQTWQAYWREGDAYYTQLMIREEFDREFGGAQ